MRFPGTQATRLVLVLALWLYYLCCQVECEMTSFHAYPSQILDTSNMNDVDKAQANQLKDLLDQIDYGCQPQMTQVSAHTHTHTHT